MSRTIDLSVTERTNLRAVIFGACGGAGCLSHFPLSDEYLGEPIPGTDVEVDGPIDWDTASSVSRQYYIDTGRYLTVAEVQAIDAEDDGRYSSFATLTDDAEGEGA